MLAAFFLFGIVGFYLDAKRGGGFAWTLTGLLLALVICGYEVWKLVRHLDREDRQRTTEDQGAAKQERENDNHSREPGR
jgi:hypothetical protein